MALLSGGLPSRIVRAVVFGSLWFFFLCVLPKFLISNFLNLVAISFSGYEFFLEIHGVIFASLTVAGELTAGTIFQQVLGIWRALLSMIFIVFASSVGKMTFNVRGVSIVVDFRICLAIFLVIDALVLARSVLQMIDFLSEKSDDGYEKSVAN